MKKKDRLENKLDLLNLLKRFVSFSFFLSFFLFFFLSVFLSFSLSFNFFLSYFMRDMKTLKTAPYGRWRLSSRPFFTYISVWIWTLSEGETSCPLLLNSLLNVFPCFDLWNSSIENMQNAFSEPLKVSISWRLLGQACRKPTEGSRVRHTETLLFSAYSIKIRPFPPWAVCPEFPLQTTCYSLENCSFIHLKIIHSYTRDYMKIWKQEFARVSSRGL